MPLWARLGPPIALIIALAPGQNARLDTALIVAEDTTDGLDFVVVTDAGRKWLAGAGRPPEVHDWGARLAGIGKATSWHGADESTCRVGLPYRNAFGLMAGAVVPDYHRSDVDRTNASMQLVLLTDWLVAAPLFGVAAFFGVWRLTRRLESELSRAKFVLLWAVSMPWAGSRCDRAGYRKAFAAGAAVTTAGLVPTAFSASMGGIALWRSVPLYLDALGGSQSATGRIMMTYGLAIILLSPTVAGLAERLGHRRWFVVAGGYLAALGVAALCFVHSTLGVALSVTLTGIAHAIGVPPQLALVSDSCQDVVHHVSQATSAGIFRLMQRLGNVTGPILFGALIPFFDFEAAFGTIALLLRPCVRRATSATFLWCSTSSPIRRAPASRGMAATGRDLKGVSHLVPMPHQLKTMQRFENVGDLGVVYNPRQANSLLAIRELRQHAAEFGFNLVEAPLDAAAGQKVIAGAAEAAMREKGALAGPVSSCYNAGTYAGYRAEQILTGARTAGSIAIDRLQRFTLLVNMGTADQLELYPPLDLVPIADFLLPVATAAKGCSRTPASWW